MFVTFFNYPKTKLLLNVYIKRFSEKSRKKNIKKVVKRDGLKDFIQ